MSDTAPSLVSVFVIESSQGTFTVSRDGQVGLPAVPWDASDNPGAVARNAIGALGIMHAYRSIERIGEEEGEWQGSKAPFAFFVFRDHRFTAHSSYPWKDLSFRDAYDDTVRAYKALLARLTREKQANAA